jgi:hypothetical protein
MTTYRARMAASLTAAVFGITLGVAGCISQPADGKTNQAPVTDPLKGWVKIREGGFDGEQDIAKRCDGTTLVYVGDGGHSGSLVVVPWSTECTP